MKPRKIRPFVLVAIISPLIFVAGYNCRSLTKRQHFVFQFYLNLGVDWLHLGGWINRLYVSTNFMRIDSGQPLSKFRRSFFLFSVFLSLDLPISQNLHRFFLISKESIQLSWLYVLVVSPSLEIKWYTKMLILRGGNMNYSFFFYFPTYFLNFV